MFCWVHCDRCMSVIAVISLWQLLRLVSTNHLALIWIATAFCPFLVTAAQFEYRATVFANTIQKISKYKLKLGFPQIFILPGHICIKCSSLARLSKATEVCAVYLAFPEEPFKCLNVCSGVSWNWLSVTHLLFVSSLAKCDLLIR